MQQYNDYTVADIAISRNNSVSNSTFVASNISQHNILTQFSSNYTGYKTITLSYIRALFHNFRLA